MEQSPVLMSIDSKSDWAWTFLLPTVTPSLLAYIKPEEFIQQISSSPRLELSYAAKEAYQKLLVGVKSVCEIYYFPFQALHGEVDQYDKKFTEGFDAVLFYFSYNTCRFAEYANSKYDRHTLQGISILLDVVSGMTYVGVHRHILYYALQLSCWYELLKGEIQYVVDPTKEEDVLMSDDLPSGKNTVLEVEGKQLQYVRSLGICHHYLRVVICTKFLLSTVQSTSAWGTTG